MLCFHLNCIFYNEKTTIYLTLNLRLKLKNDPRGEYSFKKIKSEVTKPWALKFA